MRPVKNRRRIDPRYFLNETADRDNLGDDLMPLNELEVGGQDVGGFIKQKGKQALSRFGGLGDKEESERMYSGAAGPGLHSLLHCTHLHCTALHLIEIFLLSEASRKPQSCSCFCQ